MSRILNRLRWPIVLVTAFFSALFIVWEIFCAANFLYPLWYKVLDIGDTVRVYGPQNRNRHGFEYTDEAEQTRLFAAIVRAVEHDGRGLENLYYRDANGRPIDRLLTKPEIVHLKDVARLIGGFHIFGWINILIFIAVTASLRLFPSPKPHIKKYLAYFSIVSLLCVIAVLLIGPEAVFYKLHTWIFPQGHKWFFYYQESLMTTMMKAPVLFAGIAAEWLIVTILAYVLLIGLSLSMVKSENNSQ